MIFEVGQSYKNNIGTYKILAVHNDVMDVCYSDGRRQALSVAIQTRIYENHLITQTAKHPTFKKHIGYTYSDYWTLGFLLTRLVYLQYKVMFDKQEEAKDKYFDATGQELKTVKVGVFYYRKGANQWGNQGVITFHARPSELFRLKFNGKPSPIPNSSDTYVVSDINYFYFMLQNGFSLGSNQDKDNIIKHIPNSYKAIFEQGYQQGVL